MANRKAYLLVSAIGVALAAFGQYIARPQFYGTAFGRAWAHIFWFGLLLFIGPLAALLVDYVAHNKNPLVRNAGKYQLVGTGGITTVLGLVCLIAIVMGDGSLTEFDGRARRGMFAIWLLVIIAFSIFNLILLAIRLNQPKH